MGGGKSASRHPRLTRGSKEKTAISFTPVTRTVMGGVNGTKGERFGRSNCQIWGDRALVRARASRGPDADETNLKGGELIFKPVDEILVRRIEKDEKVRQG